MNRSLALTMSAVLASSLGLFGCTIYTYSTPPPKHHPKAKPAPVTAVKPGVVKPGGNRWPTAKPGSTTGDGGEQVQTPTVTGQTIFGGPTVKGFTGLAYVIPEGTTKLPTFADLIPFGRLYTDKFEIASQTFSGGFPGALQQDEWFAIEYTGAILVPTAGKWAFTLTSDDGAALYIDNQKVIDNDGVHTVKSVTQSVELGSGRHDLRLDYFQEKKGTVALQLVVNLAGKDVPVVAAP